MTIVVMPASTQDPVPPALAGVQRALLGPHEHEIAITFEDTDLTGAVYHANYLKFFDRARVAILGANLIRKARDVLGIGFVIHKVQVSYRRPAHFADTLLIRTRLTHPAAHKLEFQQVASHRTKGHIVATASTRVVCVRLSGELAPVPVLEILRERASAASECQTSSRSERGPDEVPDNRS